MQTKDVLWDAYQRSLDRWFYHQTQANWDRAERYFKRWSMADE
jgi:hypothetical protein